ARSAPAEVDAGAAATASALVLSRAVTLSNTGTTALNWSAGSNRSWLTLDPAAGSLNAGGYTARLNATVNAAGLAAGTHTGAITVTAPGATNTPVSLDVTASVVDAPAVVPGTPLTGLAGASSSQSYFVVEVPTGATSLTVAISGGTGDADLYVRYADAPTLSLYDCRPFISGNAETCTAANPQPGPYYVMLRGFGSYSGVTLTATIGGTPGAPAGLAAKPLTTSSIQLTWADGSVNETGFTVSRRTMSAAGVWGGYVDVATTAANAASYTNTGLAQGTRYQYRLRACNAAGCSAWVSGNAVSIPTAAPAAPFGLSAAPASGTVAAVAWSDGSSDETSFSLARALRGLDGTWGAYATVRTLPADSVAYKNSSLLAGREYRYQVRACNPVGCSAWATSNVVSMPTVPAAPGGVSAAHVSAGTIRVQWADGSANETSFKLERASVSGAGVVGAFSPVANLAANQVLFNHNGLAVGTYQYRVRACNVAGCSAWATSPNAEIPPVPAAPAGLGGVVLSATSIRVSWTDGAGEASYQVYRALRNLDGTWPAYTSVRTLPANTTLYNNYSLLSGREYRYQVRACNTTGCSAWSTSDVITTP
ncbi:MAG TPA: fibronectin type III domain-containing protein, partial [Longimicrobium sp.]|nr:fibronectin type III domain-containing protein [Longimicrobium sp.]